MALVAATRLGPYEIQGLLGAGGMGEVYRALDPRLGREVAVKVLPEEVGRDPDRLARFEREARAVAALNHPNILTVHDVGTHEGTPYVVTELLDGETLRELALAPRPDAAPGPLARGSGGSGAGSGARQGNPPPRPQAREPLRHDGRAAEDPRLRPGQAVSRARPQAARKRRRPRPRGRASSLGTVGYMSPEQVRGLPLDGRSDLFSLGVVLYELLGGSTPSGERRRSRR